MFFYAISLDHCMDSLENGSDLRQHPRSSLCLESEDSKDAALGDCSGVDADDLAIDILDSVSISIIEAIKEKGQAVARDLTDTLHLSRAPVLGRLKKLTEQKILVRHPKPGTERKAKPTYVYKLSSKAERTIQTSGLGTEENSASSGVLVEANTISVMAELLEASIQEIAALRNRVSRLEAALDVEVPLNRSDLINKLKSR